MVNLTNITPPDWSNTSILEDFQYNLTRIFSSNIIERPERWVGDINIMMGGIVIISFLILLGIVLFLVSKSVNDVSDSQALMYTGLIISFLGTLLFFIEPYEGVKLIPFTYLVPVYVITLLSIVYNRMVKRY